LKFYKIIPTVSVGIFIYILPANSLLLMNTNYAFKAEKFAVSEDGLHLLRNEFNYETIPWTGIASVGVRNGKDLRNWLWVLFIGVLLTGYAVWDIIHILFIFKDPNMAFSAS
jgi:hypothetical protein